MTEPGERLNSWKEIAAYLERTIRTAQRWEHTEALPVHRHSHDRRDSVYAFKPELDAWWAARRARLEREIPEGTPVRRRRPVAAAILGMLALAGAAVWWLRPKAQTPFAQRDWVVVADFDNLTGDPVFDKGPWTAFVAGLEQSKHVNVTPEARLQAALKRMGKDSTAKIDAPLGREICLRENARRLIAGSIARDGKGYLLIVRVVDPKSGATLESYLEPIGGRDQVIRALGVLAGKVRRYLGESLPAIRESARPLPELTTPSLEALQLYAGGRRLWQTGQSAQAVDLFEAALAHDPGFAMAHASLGNAYFSHVYSDPARGRAEYRKALAEGERLTDRERLYIQATLQDNLGHVDQAAALFKIYIGAYPDDSSARYRLGSMWMRYERYPEALEQLREAIRIDPNEARSHVNLAICLRQTGESAQALAAFSKAFALEPGWITIENLNHEYGFALVCNGNTGKAREVFALALEKPASRAGALRSLALLDLYEGRYAEATPRLRECSLLTEAAGQFVEAARNRLLLAILRQGQGDAQGEMEELDRAAHDLDAGAVPQNRLCARIAANYARSGAAPKAERLLRALRGESDRENPEESSELSRVEGEAALARGLTARALELLRLAVAQSSNPLTMESLAHAYDRARDNRRAAECYEQLIAMGPRAMGWEAQQSWFAAHLRLAEAYLAMGERGKAAAAVNGLAALWVNADPGLPPVRALRQLRARIGGGD